jgi:Nucleotidyl transferase AbiEii toxin, Type IV TA system
MPDFRRPYHRAIAQILEALNPTFLEHAQCYFGGGTCISLMLDEYRESRDIDFLCSNRSGFRQLRETVRETSLGSLLRRPLTLAREVRADRDGIRTFFSVGDLRIKFEIILEARIDLRAAPRRFVGVPLLDLDCVVAEKFLANADRGLDDSTKARDFVDLAFLAAHYGGGSLETGLRLAEVAYGKAIRHYFDLSFARISADSRYLLRCARALGIEDIATLRKGVARLRTFIRQRAQVGPE